MDIKQVREYFKQSLKQHIDETNADYAVHKEPQFIVESFDELDETIDLIIDGFEEQIIDSIISNAMCTGHIYMAESE